MLLTVSIGVRSGQSLLQECIESVEQVAGEVLLAQSGPDWTDLDDALNETLFKARGDWVLFLEGHERLDADGCDLREWITAARCNGIYFRVRRMSYRLGPAHRYVVPHHPFSHGAFAAADRCSVRLFRRDAQYRFGGRLNPSIEPSMHQRGDLAVKAPGFIFSHDLLIPDNAPGRLQARLTKARRLVETHPEDADVWLDLGRLLIEQTTSVASASECFLEAWKLRPETSVCLEAACGLATQRRFEEALSFLAKAPAGAAAHDEDGIDEDVWELRGELLRLVNKHDDAESAYRKALAINRNRPLARIGLVDVLCARGEADEARSHADWVRHYYPGTSQSWIAAAIVHLQQRQLLSAIEMLKVALDIEPTSAIARYNLAIAYARLGAYGASRKALLQAGAVRGGILLACDVDVARPELQPNIELRRLGKNSVVSFIPFVAGGAGRVAVDIIRCLASDYRQALITYDSSDFVGMGLLQELRDIDVPIVSIGSGNQLASVLQVIDPEIILNHSGPPQESIPFVNSPAFQISVSHGGGPFAYTHHDRYVCLSESHRRFHAYLPDDKVRIIPNGVNLQAFENVAPDAQIWGGLDNKTVRIAMLTRLDSEKCVRRLLHYLEPLSDLDVKIVVAGQGARRWEIQSDLPGFRIGAKVSFAGSIPSHRVPSFLAAADIGLHLTEISHETLSISILEMLASGLPIVSQPRGCLPELVIHGANGFLFESESAIGAALRRLVLSQELRTTMGAASREHAAKYRMERFEENWRSLIAECIDRHRSSSPETSGQVGIPIVSRGEKALVERLTSAENLSGSVASYFIAGSRRSGGTLLCSALQSTGVAGCPREDVGAWTAYFQGRSWHYRSLDDYLMAQWRLGASARGVYGCLLMFSHWMTICDSQNTRDWPSRWLERIGRPEWIFLRRRDRLAQAISLYKAEKTRLWRDVGEARIALDDIAYDRAAIEDCRQRLERDDQAWQAFFNRFGVQRTELYYEDIANDLDGALRFILGKLRIPLPEPFVCRTPMRPQADDQTKDWMARFARGD